MRQAREGSARSTKNAKKERESLDALSIASPGFTKQALRERFAKTAPGSKAGFFGSIYDVFFYLTIGDARIAREFMELYASKYAKNYDFEGRGFSLTRSSTRRCRAVLPTS